MQACPDVSVTWGEPCAEGETRACFQYLTTEPPEDDSSDEVDTATAVVLGTLGIVGVVAGYLLIHGLCTRYVADSVACDQALSE